MAEATDSTLIFIDVATGTDTLNDIENEVIISSQTEQEVKNIAKELDPYLKIQPRRIRCKECNIYSAETEEKMLRHVRKVHRGENPFQCSLCDYSTYNKSVFEEHIRIHQGIKPFKCNFCSYRSSSKKNTKKHELIHRPDNPNRCDRCEFIGRNLKSLNHHKKTHDNSSTVPYTCKHCRRKFTDGYLLKNHYRTCEQIKKNGKKIVCKKNMFVCAICKWEGVIKAKILLHLIHHPDQEVDESVVDVGILRKCGINVGC